MFLRILGKFLSNEEFFRNAEIYMHVTYIVHGFTQIGQISLEPRGLGLNINYWLIKNYTRKTSNFCENERGDVTLSVRSIQNSDPEQGTL